MDPVGGCYRIALELRREINATFTELLNVRTMADYYRSKVEDSVANMAPVPQINPVDMHSHNSPAAANKPDHCLSLQSFQDPIFEHQHSRAAPTNQALYAFDAGGSSCTETSQRAANWNLTEPAHANGGGGYLLGVPPQSQFFAQWGVPLQSSNLPSFHAMADPNALANASGNQMHFAAFRWSSSGYPQTAAILAASAGDVVGFSGHHIPTRLRGGEEELGGIEEPPSPLPVPRAIDGKESSSRVD